ncbi:MAG TPA: hypothetical protein VFZ48_04205 [Candidatus Saccharimonadales bacterium]
MRSSVVLPKKDQLPFEAARKILEALKARDWNVPGITVEFYGRGSSKQVAVVRGENFRIEIGHAKDLDSKGLSQGASSVAIPGKQLEIFEDRSASLYVYVGGNWQKDRDRFLDQPKVISKYYGEGRWYLLYEDTSTLRRLTRTAILVHTTSLGNEYELQSGDPKQYKLNAVRSEIDQWLTLNVLSSLGG